MASGINSTFRQVGIATGIAGLGSIFSHKVRTDIVVAAVGAPHVHAQAATRWPTASPRASGAGRRARRLPAAARPTAAHAVRAGFTPG